MNRRDFLSSAVATRGAAAGIGLAVAFPEAPALAFRPLTSNGSGDGGSKRKRRKRRK